jgi:hypothetical protein
VSSGKTCQRKRPCTHAQGYESHRLRWGCSTDYTRTDFVTVGATASAGPALVQCSCLWVGLDLAQCPLVGSDKVRSYIESSVPDGVTQRVLGEIVLGDGREIIAARTGQFVLGLQILEHCAHASFTTLP